MPERSDTLVNSTGTGRRAPLPAYVSWLAWFSAALALYAATTSRGVQWQDSSHFIVRIVAGQLLNPLGLALSHPLHYWIGRLMIRPDLV